MHRQNDTEQKDYDGLTALQKITTLIKQAVLTLDHELINKITDQIKQVELDREDLNFIYYFGLETMKQEKEQAFEYLIKCLIKDEDDATVDMIFNFRESLAKCATALKDHADRLKKQEENSKEKTNYSPRFQYSGLVTSVPGCDKDKNPEHRIYCSTRYP